MNIRNLTTWDRLQALEMPSTGASFPFADRLARDNGWTQDFAVRAIEEYRKFCFLATHAGHPVTPSDQVDQVWHLHLLYSQHYWEALCGEALGTPLHHGPTRGGLAEVRKFNDWYQRTLDSYRRYFGEPPPELWPDAAERFDRRHLYVRIDKRDTITIDRRLARRVMGFSGIAMAGIGVAACASNSSHAEGQFSIATSFIWLLVAIAAVVMVLGAATAKADEVTHDPDEKRDDAKAKRDEGGPGCGGGGGGGDGGGGGGDGGCGSGGCGGGGCGGCGGCG